MGAIDFAKGTLKTFICYSFFKYWKVIGFIPKELQSNMLQYHYRVCAEGGGDVYVVNTRDMILYCFNLASKQWGTGIQIDTTYRSGPLLWLIVRGDYTSVVAAH